MRRNQAQWNFIMLLGASALLSVPAIHIFFGMPYRLFKSSAPIAPIFYFMATLLSVAGAFITLGFGIFLARKLLQIGHAWRFSLSTSIALMIVSSLILLANLHEHRAGTYGFPMDIHFYYEQFNETSAAAIIFNIEAAAILCFVTIAIGESLSKEHHPDFAPMAIRTLTILNRTPAEFIAPPPEDKSLVPRYLSDREKWVYAIPMFLFFAFICAACVVMAEAKIAFIAYRLDLPLPTAWGLCLARIGDQYPSMLFLFMLGVAWGYFGWAVKDRRRVLVFNLLILSLMLLGLIGLALAALLPFFSEGRCVVSGARVRVPSGERLIDDVNAGDEILSAAPNGEIQISVVTSKNDHVAEEWLLIALSGGMEVSVTAEHPLALGNQWIRAGQLSVGDIITTAAAPAKVEQITRKNHPVRVFDISVSPHANFFANGVLVHNALKKK